MTNLKCGAHSSYSLQKVAAAYRQVFMEVKALLKAYKGQDELPFRIFNARHNKWSKSLCIERWDECMERVYNRVIMDTVQL